MAKFRPFKLLLLTAITLWGAFFRLYRIDSLPPGETYDPAFYGLDALAILQGERPIFFETNFGREALFSYLVAACVAVFGVGSLAIHLASAIVGPLSYGGITYLSGGNHRLALLSTVAFFALGLVLLATVNEKRGQAAALAA